MDPVQNFFGVEGAADHDDVKEGIELFEFSEQARGVLTNLLKIQDGDPDRAVFDESQDILANPAKMNPEILGHRRCLEHFGQGRLFSDDQKISGRFHGSC